MIMFPNQCEYKDYKTICACKLFAYRFRNHLILLESRCDSADEIQDPSYPIYTLAIFMKESRNFSSFT